MAHMIEPVGHRHVVHLDISNHDPCMVDPSICLLQFCPPFRRVVPSGALTGFLPQAISIAFTVSVCQNVVGVKQAFG